MAWWAEALLWAPKEITEVAPNVPKEDFLTRKNSGAEIFKNYATNSVTVDDLDTKIADVTNKKITAYADLTKYFKSRWEDVSPAKIMALSDAMHSELSSQASELVKEKQARFDTASKTAEADYQSLSSKFMTARKQQMWLDQELYNETIKTVSDPARVTELMTQKDQADKKVESIKKEFSKKGINEPEAILNEQEVMAQDIKDMQAKWVSLSDIRSLMIDKYPDQVQTIVEATAGNVQNSADQILYSTALGQYDNAEWNFQPKAFMADLQSVPEYQWLPKEQIVAKLITQETDPEVLKDVFFITNQLEPDTDVTIWLLKQKWLTPEEITDITINWYAGNLNKGKRDVATMNNIIQSLRKIWVNRSQIKGILRNYGVSLTALWWRKIAE